MIKELHNWHLLLELPEGAENIKVTKRVLHYNLIAEEFVHHIPLPPGDYDIKRVEEMTEEECVGLVDRRKEHFALKYDIVEWEYKDYMDSDQEFMFETGKESFLSLIRSHNFNPSETIILIKKQ